MPYLSALEKRCVHDKALYKSTFTSTFTLHGDVLNTCRCHIVYVKYYFIHFSLLLLSKNVWGLTFSGQSVEIFRHFCLISFTCLWHQAISMQVNPLFIEVTSAQTLTNYPQLTRNENNSLSVQKNTVYKALYYHQLWRVPSWSSCMHGYPLNS